jgi:hypothetical protein
MAARAGISEMKAIITRVCCASFVFPPLDPRDTADARRVIFKGPADIAVTNYYLERPDKIRYA